MTGRERLDSYLAWMRRRLRRVIYARAFALASVLVLAVTVLGAWLLWRSPAIGAIALSVRIAIGAFLIAIAVLMLWKPLRRLRRDDGAEVFERCMPAQQGRIRTYLEGGRAAAQPSLLLDLLAEDAAAVLERDPPARIVSRRRLFVPAGVGAAALAALVALLFMGPAHWGVGSRHLLFGAELPREFTPIRRLLAAPGDATVRRNSDLAITAQAEGFRPDAAQVFVRFDGESGWERAPMQPNDAAQFAFTLFAVRGPLSYYVEAQGVRTPEHRVGVVDLPRIDRVRLTYSYPEWTGLAPAVDEEVRDILAVAGTNVQIEVFADAPLEAAALLVNGAQHPLSSRPEASVGNIEVAKPGSYLIGAKVANEFVALSDEYAIEIAVDEKPTIEIRKPGRDFRASSIEEVPVQVEAADDYRLRNVELRYSVNGGEWKALPLAGSVKQARSESLLRLEELGLEHGEAARLSPGDLVSYYAVATDRGHTAQTDLFLVQVQPFERRFTQGQAGAQSGGMGDEQDAISERQRELLLATWNLQRNDERQARTRAQLRDNAEMLAELQAKLADQARTLAARTRARAGRDDQRATTFIESLERAAEAMRPAAEKLAQFKLAEATPAQQQALQQLLRAEEAFREVQVAMQQDSSQSGGAQASRNFTEMFELEMDLEKSQYETESQLSMRNEKEELDEALRKLKELAERQEKLAEQAQQAALPPEEQRWRQEQLRREAEDLKRRLAQMNAQRQRANAAGDPRSGQSGESSGEPQASPSSEGASPASREELARTLESMNRALEEMRAANEQTERDPRGASQSAAEAGEKLRQALRGMDQPTPAGLDQALEQLAERARDLSEQQGNIESELYRALSQAGGSPDQFGSRSALDRSQAQSLVQSKQALANDLTELQRDLRGAVHEHRARAPETSRRVGEIIRDLEASEVMYRVNRSAAEIYYGRAREAALREGLISEALDHLEQDLREAAAQAAQERQGAPRNETNEQLLAQLAELRRTLQAAQQQAGQEQQSTQQEGGHEQRTAQQRGGGSSSSSSISDSAADAAAPGEFDSRRSGRELQVGERSFARETAELTQRVRDAVFRIDRRELTSAEMQALRNRANELRRMGGDHGIDQQQAMLKLVDQIELTALNALSDTRRASAARAARSPREATQDQEAVAEYYRRLAAD